MDYLLKASGLVIILLIFYYVFLKNETFFKSIRSYFLLGFIVIISIPLIEIPVYVEQVTSPLNLLDYDNFVTNQTSVEKAFNRTQLFTQLYSIGVILFSFKFLVQLASLLLLISKHKPIKQGNFIFIETSKKISPFSFFNIIIYNKEQFSIEELEQIINHEKAHASQWHSIDTILVHILVILLWFNPFAWLYKKSTQQNLEFLADSHALKLSKNEQLYQLTLLKTCTVNYGTAITTNFYNSLIKKRIVMLHKNPTHHKGQWKYALLLPLLIAFVFIFNTKIIAQEKNSIEIKEINNSKAELVIDKNSNEESLKKEEAFFKKEFNINLSFKGIQRNSSNEITSIKIEAKGEKAQAKFENAGSEPIKPIKLSYDSEVNSISIGNLDRRKIGNYSYITHEESDVELNGEPHENKNYIFVTSDGNKTKWITKEHHDSTWIDNKNKNKESKIIIIKSDKDKHKKENKIEFSSEEDSEIEVINEGDESVYIIKTAGDKTIKQKISKKGDVLFISSDQEEPLYIIDGKEISADENDDIKQENIEKIEVFKGEKATEKYGDKGKNGVIIITTKKE